MVDEMILFIWNTGMPVGTCKATAFYKGSELFLRSKQSYGKHEKEKHCETTSALTSMLYYYNHQLKPIHVLAP